MNELHRCADCQNREPLCDLFHDRCSVTGRRISLPERYQLRACAYFRWNPENELTELEHRVLEALKDHCWGEANASPAPEVGKLAGLQDRDGRTTRDIISSLRRKGGLHGVLIASGARGFYIPQDEEESLRCLQTLQSREDEAAETRAAYERLHRELYGRRWSA